MVKALTRLVFPLISCCTKAIAALHLTGMAQQQGTPRAPETGSRSSHVLVTANCSRQLQLHLLNILNPSAFKPYKSSRDLTITQKGTRQFSDLIIRGCIPSYLKRRWCISNPRLQSPNHPIFLWAHMKGLSSFPTVSMVSENKHPVVSVEPNWDQQHTHT